MEKTPVWKPPVNLKPLESRFFSFGGHFCFQPEKHQLKEAHRSVTLNYCHFFPMTRRCHKASNKTTEVTRNQLKTSKTKRKTWFKLQIKEVFGRTHHVNQERRKLAKVKHIVCQTHCDVTCHVDEDKHDMVNHSTHPGHYPSETFDQDSSNSERTKDQTI